jgi:hypothetical protein
VAQRRIELQVPSEEAFERLQKAFAEVGKVREVGNATRSLRGHLRVGIMQAEFRVSVLSSADGASSVLEIQGPPGSIDGFGHEARAVDRLIGALDAS